MKNDKETILGKLDFEDKGYLLSILEAINKAPVDNLIATIKPFLNFYSTIKVKLKAIQHPSNGLPKDDVLSGVKLFLMYTEISLFQEKFYHNSEVETNFITESSLLINNIYKLLSLKEKSFTEKGTKKNELDIVISQILSKYVENINNYQDFVNLIENQSKKTNKDNLSLSSILSYDQFQRYFKILLKFLLFVKGFERIYKNTAKNNKILPGDIIICLNKIIKNLNENNLFYMIAKKMLEMVTSMQANNPIEKDEYYIFCIKALT